MTQEDGDLDGLVRKRIRALRVAQGWSLDELATRARLSQSSLSRIENGQRRLALDQLVTLARALDTSLDQLVETDTDDVIVSPMIDGAHGDDALADQGRAGHDRHAPADDHPAARQPRLAARALRAANGWSCSPGTAVLLLGNRRFRVETNQAAEFPTMLPHAIGTAGGPCEILGIFDREARRGHNADKKA